MKRILYAISIVYVIAALVAGVFILNVDYAIGSKGISDCKVTNESVYLVEQTGRSSILYLTSHNGTVREINKLSAKRSDLKAECIELADALYVVTSCYDGYQLYKFDDDLNTVSKSDYFGLGKDTEVSSVRILNGSAYISVVESGDMASTCYVYNLSDLSSDISKEEEMSEDSAPPEDLESVIRVESSVGGIPFAYYDGKTVIIDPNGNTSEQEHIKEYKNNLDMSFKQSVLVNTTALMVVLAVIIFGLILIAVIANLISLRRRYINHILINEVLIIIGFISVLLSNVDPKYAVIWFVIFTVINVVAMLFENRDVMVLSSNMKRISNENYDIRRPLGDFYETQTIWRGLNELRYQLERCKYINESSAAAAMKFLPKNICSIFSKSSIDELKSGETARVEGALMILRRTGNLSGELVQAIEKYEDDTNGMFIVGDCNISDVKMLFSSDNSNIIQRGMEFGSLVFGQGNSALYFKDIFEFSIAGTSTRAIIDFSSNNMDEMESLSRWFGYLGLRMVITEDIKENSLIDSPVRYMGYTEFGGHRLKYYEVLNVYDESVRTRRIKNIDDFDKALNMFYENDFYLARTAFSDILKTDNTDELSRWYLFMCEKYLNESGGNVSFVLDPRS